MSGALARFWMERAERERAVIAIASIMAAFALAYAYVWLPVTRERDRLLVRVQELRGDALAMERDSRELGQLRNIPSQPVGLKAAIEQAASTYPTESALEIVQHDPARIRITIASATTSQALDSVARLQKSPGIRAESVRLTSLGDVDRVKLEAVFVKSP